MKTISDVFSEKFNNFPVNLFAVNSNFNIVNLNKCAKEIYGNNCISLFLGEALKCLNYYINKNNKGSNCKKCVISKMILDGFKENKTYKNKKVKFKTSNLTYVYNVSTLILNNNNEKYIILSLENLTELKELEKALINTTNNLDNIIDNDIYGIIITNNNNNIEYINNIAKKIFNEKIFINKKLNFNIKNDLIDLDNGITCKIKYKNIMWNKKEANLIYFSDITKELKIEEHKKTLEKQLIQAQKMEDIAHLTCGISHDFNNILMPALFYLKQSLELSNDPKLSNDISKVINILKTAKNLNSQLLTFSRNEKIEKEKLNINKLIEEFFNILKVTIGKSYKIELELDENVKEIISSKIHIQQIIINLVINAKDAILNNGKIKISTSHITKKQKDIFNKFNINENEYLKLTISDNGKGMDKKIMSKIFDPFFTTKEEGKGTGLGLAVTYNIIKENNANIFVNSIINKGTTFDIFFKYDEPKNINKDISIILVDDDEIILNLVNDILISKKFTVHKFIDPIKALEFSENNKDIHIDILLTDYMMNKLNGKELFKKIKEKRPNIKALFMSGYTNNKDNSFEFNSNKSTFLFKPFDMKDLMDAMNKVIEL